MQFHVAVSCPAAASSPPVPLPPILPASWCPPLVLWLVVACVLLRNHVSPRSYHPLPLVPQLPLATCREYLSSSGWLLHHHLSNHRYLLPPPSCNFHNIIHSCLAFPTTSSTQKPTIVSQPFAMPWPSEPAEPTAQLHSHRPPPDSPHHCRCRPPRPWTDESLFHLSSLLMCTPPVSVVPRPSYVDWFEELVWLWLIRFLSLASLRIVWSPLRSTHVYRVLNDNCKGTPTQWSYQSTPDVLGMVMVKVRWFHIDLNSKFPSMLSSRRPEKAGCKRET